MQATNPFISLIVPSYNRAALIDRTLNSLLNQNYDSYEIIVVDDGSTDDTEEVVKSIKSDRITYVRKTNGERAAARNFGAHMAKGDYINFFDSDDLALSNHLTVAEEIVKKYNRPEWFHLGYAWATPEERVFKEVNHYKGETLNNLMVQGNPLSCNGVFIRKDVILNHPFNEDRELSASEDYELWVRLAARYPLYYTNVITSLVIDHEMRSVRRINGKKLIRRLELLIKYLQQDSQVSRAFGSSFKKIKADSYSYIALHLAENRSYKRQSIGYIWQSLKVYPGIIRRKRFAATIKNLLIKWQKS